MNNILQFKNLKIVKSRSFQLKDIDILFLLILNKNSNHFVDLLFPVETFIIVCYIVSYTKVIAVFVDFYTI